MIRLSKIMDETFRPTKGPIKMKVVKNFDAAPNLGSRFGQNIEPSGTYVIEQYKDEIPPGNWKAGVVSFKNPYYISVTGATLVSWKQDLSNKYDGKRKNSLTSAMKRDGYDGIITYDSYGTGEIIVFDNAKLKFK